MTRIECLSWDLKMCSKSETLCHLCELSVYTTCVLIGQDFLMFPKSTLSTCDAASVPKPRPLANRQRHNGAPRLNRCPSSDRLHGTDGELMKKNPRCLDAVAFFSC